jgi:hypothetical protein
VVNVEKADHIASILALKREIEEGANTPGSIRLTITGSTEAHLLASEIADANVGVVLIPSRPFPASFDKARFLAGPPLTSETSLSVLRGHNVTVGVGVAQEWQARGTRWDIAWVSSQSLRSLSLLRWLIWD